MVVFFRKTIMLLGGLILVLVGNILMHERFDYVRLPNGCILALRGIMGETVALLSDKGKEKLSEGVMEIRWSDDYVTGRQMLSETSRYFIYVKETDQVFFAGEEEYAQQQEKLRESVLFEEEKTFGDLIGDSGFRRRWWE